MLAIWAAAIAVPSLLILYFLKLRRRDVEISTTLLWKKAIEDFQANAPFQRLRKNILLLVQLLALGAALFALGQPQFRGATTSGGKHVILIDRSASMSALDAKNEAGKTVSRLDAAKEQAIKLVDSFRDPGIIDRDSGDQGMVISFDVSGKALQAFTSDKEQLKAAIRAIQPSDAPSSIEEAFKLVEAQAPRQTVVETREDGSLSEYERPPGKIGTIHLYSDGRLPDIQKVIPGREDTVLFHAIGGSSSGNVGITSLRAVRAFDEPNKLSIFIGLDNAEAKARTVDVECQIDGNLVGIKGVELPPAAAPSGNAPPAPGTQGPPLIPGTNGAVFNIERPQGGIVTVRVVPPAEDVLSVDNLAWLVVPPAKKLAVAVVTTGNDFILDALFSMPYSKLQRMTPQEFEDARTKGTLREYDVVLLDGYLPSMPKDASSPLPAGRWLVLGAVPQAPDLLVDSGKVESGSTFLDWSRDHPALRGVALEPVVIAETRKLEIPKGSGAVVLATGENGPAMVEFTTPEAHAIVVPFDLAKSNWPFEISMVVFLAQAVGHLGDDDAGLGQMVKPGGVLTDHIPLNAKDVKVRLPSGEQASAGEPAPDGKIVYGPIQRSGVYMVSWQGPPGPTDAVDGQRAIRPFAANLLSSPESDVAATSALSFASRDVTANDTSETKSIKRLWPWLLLACLGFVLFEWWVYNRKVQF
jgi:hypothetical protein